MKFAIYCDNCGRTVPITPDLEASFRERSGLSQADPMTVLGRVMPKLRCSVCGAQAASLTAAPAASLDVDAANVQKVTQPTKSVEIRRPDNAEHNQTGHLLVVARLVSAGVLIGALAPNAYGYYVLLRWIVCGTSVLMSLVFSATKKPGWAWTFGIVAVLFNPIIPFGLDRETWAPIDIGVAVLMLVSIGILQKPLSRSGNR